MEYIDLTLVDGTSILPSYCFKHHPSTSNMYVTMLLIVFMIHTIHVFCIIHMAHIVKWEKIVLTGHVGHLL
jgi:ascorbate-specific PTS system EIIC-type component UlaA